MKNNDLLCISETRDLIKKYSCMKKLSTVPLKPTPQSTNLVKTPSLDERWRK
jgi:hypothetical protein